MAASYETSGIWTDNFVAAGTAITNAFDAGSGANRVLYVAVTWDDFSTHTIDAVTYNAVGLTAMGDAIEQGSNRTRMFRLAGPASGSNDLVVDPSGGTGTNEGVVIAAVVVQDADQGTPEDGYATANDADYGTPWVSAVTIAGETDDLIVVFHGVHVNSGGVTELAAAPTNYTTRQTAAIDRMGMTCGTAASAASVATSAGWTGTGLSAINWVAMGVNVNAAGAAASPSLVSRHHPRGVQRGVLRGIS